MITIENLTKCYGATTVVDGVSMQIPRNSLSVIVGTSGSGKSTLLRMVNRLVEPTSGRVLLDGKDTRAEAPHLLRRRIGYAIQGHGLFPHRTVAENIATVPRLMGWDAARIEARITELLEAFELDPPPSPDSFRTSSPAVSSSASAWRARSRPSRSCCSWTSPSVRSTPSSVPRPRTICWISGGASALPSCWSRTT
jgi:ABC-type proline/glycine betaine transport system ATPase subunit